MQLNYRLVNAAHLKVLKDYRVEKLMRLLKEKGREILEAKGVNVEVFNSNYKC